MDAPGDLDARIGRAASAAGPFVFLTGAGISAESGIPTFRGTEGYWTVGSLNYQPMELATREAFERVPEDVWGWYLYRRAVCRAARPNVAHEALARLEAQLGDRFLLVTQNVDGLHLRAGNSLERTYQIHGNIDFLRCADGCHPDAHPLPEAIGHTWAKGQAIGAEQWKLLCCPRCGGRARPHVLWFDEYYDEATFRFESSLAAATSAAMLIVVGTSGSTNLPNHMCATVMRRGAPMVVVDLEPTTFSAMAEHSRDGLFWRAPGTAAVPVLADLVATTVRSRGARAE